MNDKEEIRMKCNPRTIGFGLLYMVCSSFLVEILKLPCKAIVSEYPIVATWLLAIFLSGTIALLIYLSYNAVGQHYAKKQLRDEESRCKSLLDEMKKENRRKEELEILRRKEKVKEAVR